MSESMIIHLNSKYATIKNTPYINDYTFELPQIEVSQTEYLYLSIININVPFSFYNVNDTNNILHYYELDVNDDGIIYELTYTIPDGSYTAKSLAKVLTDNLTRFTVSYNSLINKFIFTNTTYNFAFLIDSTCKELLGLHYAEDVLNASSAKTYTSYNQVDLMPYKMLCIQSNNIKTQNINISQMNEYHLLGVYPISVPPFSVINYHFDNPHKINLYSNTFNSINIKLTDENNELLPILSDWSLTIGLDGINFTG
jgi:hypothetical protein